MLQFLESIDIPDGKGWENRAWFYIGDRWNYRNTFAQIKNKCSLKKVTLGIWLDVEEKLVFEDNKFIKN